MVLDVCEVCVCLRKKSVRYFVVVVRVYVSMSLYRFLILSYYLLNFD